MRQIPILMYHALEDEDHPTGSTDPGEKFYEITTDIFRTQMHSLSEGGYRTYLLEEIVQCSSFPDKAVVLTFDDGHCSNYDLALPILQEFGFRAEFFITSGWTGTPRYLASTQIHEMAELGMGIGSHGVTHSFLNDLTDAEIHKELLESRRTLCTMSGKDITAFSAPGGRINEQIIKLGRQTGYRIFCGSTFDYLREGKNVSCIPRLVITRALKLSEFEKMARTDQGYLKRKRRRYILLSYFKKILGNQIYANLHSLVSRGRHMVFKQ